MPYVRLFFIPDPRSKGIDRLITSVPTLDQGSVLVNPDNKNWQVDQNARLARTLFKPFRQINNVLIRFVHKYYDHQGTYSQK